MKISLRVWEQIDEFQVEGGMRDLRFFVIESLNVTKFLASDATQLLIELENEECRLLVFRGNEIGAGN